MNILILIQKVPENLKRDIAIFGIKK